MRPDEIPFRRARRASVAVAFLALALANVDALVVQRTTPAPPALAATPAVAGAELTEDGDTRRLGRCWAREHRGQHVLYLEGDPYSVGYCNSALTAEILPRQEQALHTALETFVPLSPLRHALLRTLAWVYRELPEHVIDSHREEIHGLADGYADPNRHLGPAYGRIMYYHAIHDISQAMVDNPILACSAFAASGGATADGHTLLARVFDFEGGRVFDEDKVVVFTRPDYGIPFASVVWAGMAGAVSGLNAEGIGVVLNAAGSDDAAVDGTPTTLVVRDILQYARTVDEAIALVRQRRVFVTDILVVADGDTGELAVIEITPDRVGVRRQDEVVLATNHLLAPAFDDDVENGERMLEGTTNARYNRLAEVVERARGRLGPAAALEILRDRAGPGGQALGLGHRGTIDALIAAHSVVFDLTSRRLWVSTSPHTLGEHVEYDLREVFDRGLRDHGALPADPMLADGRWERLVEARELVTRAGNAPDEEAVDMLRRALELAPDHPPALLALGERCEDAGKPACAIDAYRRFLASHPPYRKNALLAEERLAALGAE